MVKRTAWDSGAPVRRSLLADTELLPSSGLPGPLAASVSPQELCPRSCPSSVVVAAAHAADGGQRSARLPAPRPHQAAAQQRRRLAARVPARERCAAGWGALRCGGAVGVVQDGVLCNLHTLLLLRAELHVVEGVPSFIFVQAKYTVEVGAVCSVWECELIAAGMPRHGSAASCCTAHC